MNFNWTEVKPHCLNFCFHNYRKRISKNVLYVKLGKLTNTTHFQVFMEKQSMFGLFIARIAQL